MRGRTFSFIVALTGLMVVSQPAAWGFRQSSQLAKTNVEFQLYRDYMIVVQGSVGPLKGLNFLLDTGTNTTVLDPRLARKLRLETAPTDVAVLGGRVKGSTATVPSLQFGPVRRDNVSVLVEDLFFVQDALPLQIDAIVGLDVLGQSSFVIDYSSREIRFGPTPAMPNSIRLQLNDGLAFVDAVVNHTRVRLLVDTAAPSLLMFEELPESAQDNKGSGDGPPTKERSTAKKIGDYDHQRVRQVSLRLGEVEFGREAAFVVPNHKDSGHDFDGLMSPVALGFTRVAVDLNQKTLAFAR
jgi:hypothetical protein